MKNIFKKIKGSYLQFAGVLLLVLLAAALLWFNNRNSTQSLPAIVSQIYFDGEYRVADGDWHAVEEGKHIPTTEGDVVLRGYFHEVAPNGEYVGIYRGDLPIAFYANHISFTIYEENEITFVSDTERFICGASWMACYLTGDKEGPIEIRIHNPHSVGNETAIDEMLSSFALWTGIDFEKEIIESGRSQRTIGILFVVVAAMLLGIALFSTLIHIKNVKIIWMLGLVVMFAGCYFTYSARGVSFWSESIATNTTLLCVSVMLYMLFLLMNIVYLLKVTRRIGDVTVIALTALNAVLFILPMVTKILLYDTLFVWIAAQTVANIVLSLCLVKEFFTERARGRWIFAGLLLPLIAFVADAIGVILGVWSGGVLSRYVFVALFIVVLVTVLKLIPGNINAAAKARELEIEKTVLNAELAESRISTMMSQIRPHFIYNTLGSIEQLCKLDPVKAGDLVHNFAKYLRGNFGELDNPKPILMSQEMEHVHHYVNIENVRFPDMTFSFEMDSEDFRIPALTVQPIVENAIKHGLMRLPRGGTIRVVSYETEDAYCILVEDNGAGFDTEVLLDDRKHVGLRNIRERLKVMVNGRLDIESTVGVGTKVSITIPKEEKK